MIVDWEKEDFRQLDGYDVCVVGAGAAGIVLTLELLQQGKRVLLLEGGGRQIEERSQEPYRSEIAGHRHNGIHTGRFRAHGGTTTKWGGQILEYDEIDFEERQWVAGSGWPFPKSTLTPFYTRATRWEGIANATLQDDAVWREIGVAPPADMEEAQRYFSRWCPEPNFARLHRSTLENSEQCTVLLHANVVATELSEDRSHIRKLKFRSLEGKTGECSADVFVFCLGTIESCRFFLQPGSAAVWNASGLIGRHFQDHIDCNVARVKVKDPRRFHEQFDNVFSRGYKYHPKVKLRPETEAKEHLLQAAATMYFKGDVEEDLARVKTLAKAVLHGRTGEITAQGIAHAIANLPMVAQQAYRYKVAKRAFNPASLEVYLRVHCEQEPLSPSSITLSDQSDSLGLYRTRLDWKITETELRSLRRAASILTASIASTGVAAFEAMPAMGSDEELRDVCDDSNHHMGGMRMHDSAAQGVVDRNLKLHGARNGFVLSGAVFPTSGFSNPTHTLLALAVRLSDHLSSIA